MVVQGHVDGPRNITQYRDQNSRCAVKILKSGRSKHRAVMPNIRSVAAGTDYPYEIYHPTSL